MWNSMIAEGVPGLSSIEELRIEISGILQCIRDGTWNFWQVDHVNTALLAQTQLIILITRILADEPFAKGMVEIMELYQMLSWHPNFWGIQMLSDLESLHDDMLLKFGQDTYRNINFRFFADAFKTKIAALFDSLQALSMLPQHELTEPIYQELIIYYNGEIKQLTQFDHWDPAAIPDWISAILACYRKESTRASPSWKTILRLKQAFFDVHNHYLVERIRFTNWYCPLKINFIKYGPEKPTLSGTIIYRNTAYTGKPCNETSRKGFIIQYTV